MKGTNRSQMDLRTFQVEVTIITMPTSVPNTVGKATQRGKSLSRVAVAVAVKLQWMIGRSTSLVSKLQSTTKKTGPHSSPDVAYRFPLAYSRPAAFHQTFEPTKGSPCRSGVVISHKISQQRIVFLCPCNRM